MLITKARHTTECFKVSHVLQGHLSTFKLVAKPKNCLLILACFQGPSYPVAENYQKPCSFGLFPHVIVFISQ